MEPVYQVHPPSSIIQAELPDGRIISGSRGEPVGQFLAQISGEFDREPVGAIVNHELRELTYRLESNAKIEGVTTAISDGKNIYTAESTLGSGTKASRGTEIGRAHV